MIAVGLVLTRGVRALRVHHGITGQFFRQFALTIAVSTVISAFNSLTLSPALTALLLRPQRQERTRRAAAAAGVLAARRLARLAVPDAAWLAAPLTAGSRRRGTDVACPGRRRAALGAAGRLGR